MEKESLSMMKKIVLFKSILSTIPIYLMSNYVIPRDVLMKFKDIIKNFFYGVQKILLGRFIFFLGIVFVSHFN